MLGRFNKIFGIQENLLTEQGRFVERINQTAFPRVQGLTYPVAYESIFQKVCYCLGTNANDRISGANRMNYDPYRKHIPSLSSLTNNDFMATLKVLVILYGCLKNTNENQKELSVWIDEALEHATIDIGIRWKEGMFYPSGAKELDEKLIEEPLEWLGDFQEEKIDYLKALEGYSNNRIDDVIVNCYLVVEGIARKILGNKKTLDNNREEFIKKIGLSQEWKSLLSNFIHYANEFKRHASDKRHNVNPIEVEGFLYMTGVLVRMIIECTKTDKKEVEN